MATAAVGHIAIAVGSVSTVCIMVNVCIKQLITVVAVMVLARCEQVDQKISPPVLTGGIEFKAIVFTTAKRAANAGDALTL